MLTADQREARKQGLGASDVAPILGVSEQRTALEVYLSKVGQEDGLTPEHMRWGNRLEDDVADAYAERTGTKLRRCNTTLRHANGVSIGHPDRLIVGRQRGLEVKIVSGPNVQKWGPEGTQEVGIDAWVQCQQYMGLMDYGHWDIAALLVGYTLEMRVYTLARDPEFIEQAQAAQVRFWTDHILACRPPEPKQTRDLAAVRRLFGAINEDIVDLEAVRPWRDVHQESRRLSTQYGKTADLAEAHILASMGEAGTGTFPDGGVYLRKLRKRKGYTVEPLEFIQTTYKAPKAEKPVAQLDASDTDTF